MNIAPITYAVLMPIALGGLTLLRGRPPGKAETGVAKHEPSAHEHGGAKEDDQQLHTGDDRATNTHCGQPDRRRKVVGIWAEDETEHLFHGDEHADASDEWHQRPATENRSVEDTLQ